MQWLIVSALTSIRFLMQQNLPLSASNSMVTFYHFCVNYYPPPPPPARSGRYPSGQGWGTPPGSIRKEKLARAMGVPKHCLRACNIHEKDVKRIADSYIEQVAKVWTQLSFQTPWNRQVVLAQPIWYNSNLRIDNAPIKDNYNAIDKISKFEHILIKKPSGERLITWQELKQQLPDIPTNFLMYLSITASVPKEWLKILKLTGIIEGKTLRQKAETSGTHSTL